MTAAARNIAICANKLILILRAILESLALCIAKAFNFPSRIRRCAGRARARRPDRRGAARPGGDELFNLVEGDRLAAIRRREAGSAQAGGAELQQRTMNRSAAAATDLTRAFSIWFQAVNTAEKVHRVRRRRQYLNDSSTSQPGGIADCIARLQRDGVTLAQALELIASMSLEPVFTGHPTESTPHHPAQAAAHRPGPARPPQPRLDPGRIGHAVARVRLEITSIWQTKSIRAKD